MRLEQIVLHFLSVFFVHFRSKTQESELFVALAKLLSVETDFHTHFIDSWRKFHVRHYNAQFIRREVLARSIPLLLFKTKLYHGRLHFREVIRVQRDILICLSMVSQ